MGENETSIVKGNILFPCCAEPANLERTERLSETLTVRYCRVCGRRHFEGEAPPLELGLSGARLG